MKILVILWILSLDTLGSSQKVFDGPLDACRMVAAKIMLDDEKVAAGCYENSKHPPYIAKEKSKW